MIAQSNQEEFTRVEVPKVDGVDPTPFSIYWIVPNESYKVQIDLNQDGEARDTDCEEIVDYLDLEEGIVDYLDLEEGEVFELNEGMPIDETDENGICF